jgi:hypothetical protein
MGTSSATTALPLIGGQAEQSAGGHLLPSYHEHRTPPSASQTQFNYVTREVNFTLKFYQLARH